MSEPQFFQTRMGKTFYEHTMPELVRQLERLNENLERRVGAPQLQQATEDLVAAVDRLLDCEIVPGSATTTAAFGELRRAVCAARDAVHKVAG